MDDIPHASAKNTNLSPVDCEKGKVKEFVSRHYEDVIESPLFSAEKCSVKGHGSLVKRQTAKSPFKIQQRAVFSGKILSFGCSLCKDSLTFSPNDLLKHFQAAHRGSLPTYPCDLCDFVASEFPALQRHRIEHRNTLVSCELCDDDVQYSLLLLTRHYMLCHSTNGQFRCDWCEFTTVDAGTFVQHMHHHNECHWRCSKCRHISLNEEDHQAHLRAHIGSFPFTCQTCGYGAEKNELLNRHTAVVHKEESERWGTLKACEDGALSANLSADLKFLKKSRLSQEPQRTSKLQFPLNVQHQNGRLVKVEKLFLESQHGVERNGAKLDHRTAEQSSAVTFQECDSSNSETGCHSSANGCAVLKLKNKISLPPHCTTKVMGFRMVDGKKHLVLKVIPAPKLNVPAPNSSPMDGAGSLLTNPVTDQSKDFVANGLLSKHKSSTSPCLAVSPKAQPCVQVDPDDIMSVKVKFEEEEAPIYSVGSSPKTMCSLDTSLVCTSSPSPALNETVDEQNQCGSVDTRAEEQGQRRDYSSSTADDVIHHSDVGHFELVDTNVSSKRVLGKTAESSKATGQASPTDNSIGSPDDDQRVQVPTEQKDATLTKSKTKNGSESLHPPEASSQSPQPSSDNRTVGNYTPNISHQEVFNFHNYSKESFKTSSSASQDLSFASDDSESEENACDSSEFSLMLPESPEPVPAGENFARTGDVPVEETPDSVLQDFNIIKIEEENVPISAVQSETKNGNTSLEKTDNKCSSAITGQICTEQAGPSSTSNEVMSPKKTNVQIVQLPGGKQTVFVRSAENRSSVPVQVKAPAGFQLISSSLSPRIKISCMAKGLENSNGTNGLTLASSTKLLSLPVGKLHAPEKGTPLLSAVQSGAGATSNHYFINSPAVKGPVILSRTLNSTAATKLAQPTCYLVQRSVPFVPAQGTRSPANPQPVPAETPSATPAGRQAYLLRYISPSKPGLFLNKQAAQSGGQNCGDKVVFKLVAPPGSLQTSGVPASNHKPLFLAAAPQAQCFLVASNKISPASSRLKKLLDAQNVSENDSVKFGVTSPMNGRLQQCDVNGAFRSTSQRKRHRKALFDEVPATTQKAKRLSSEAPKESVVWEPASKETERTLRLAPFSPAQQIKCPCRNQPVVVLNHPDADIPEVVNIMKVVNRHKGAVTKVSLSPKTAGAIADSNFQRPRSVESCVRERFLLRMKLRRKSKRKYEVVKSLSTFKGHTKVFDCWFCGRLFDKQEDWIGHGQRHLMEATRDWNQLF